MSNAKREHKSAQQDLERVTRRDQAETPDYERANQRVAEAEKRVGWFRR